MFNRFYEVRRPLQELTSIVNSIDAKLSREMYIHFTVLLSATFPMIFSIEISLRVHCDGLYMGKKKRNSSDKKFYRCGLFFGVLIFMSGRIVSHWMVSDREDRVLRQFTHVLHVIIVTTPLHSCPRPLGYTNTVNVSTWRRESWSCRRAPLNRQTVWKIGKPNTVSGEICSNACASKVYRTGRTWQSFTHY